MIRLENVTKTYATKNGDVHALGGIDLQVQPEEFLVVRGPSGSGKTTLLMAIGSMLRPSQGKVIIRDTDIYSLSSKERASFRAQNIGFVFQMFHLVPYLSVIENVLLAGGVAGGHSSRDEARAILDRLGLTHRETHTPAALSAGERQRTALARALLNKPQIILADEPTGNLDPDNAQEVIRHLDEFRRQGGAVIVVTHGSMADSVASRTVLLDNGKISNTVQH